MSTKNTPAMKESVMQLNQSYYLRLSRNWMSWMQGRWVGLVEFYSHNFFEEFAVTLIKGLRVVIRELTEVSFFIF